MYKNFKSQIKIKFWKIVSKYNNKKISILETTFSNFKKATHIFLIKKSEGKKKRIYTNLMKLKGLNYDFIKFLKNIWI